MSQSVEKKRLDGLAVQILVSLATAMVGGLLLFVPQIRVDALCYVFCVALIAAGVAGIVRFFLTGAYKELRNYQFAVGIMLLILGICGLLRVADLVENFETFTGFICLALGTVILQSAVQLRVLESALWIPELVFALLVLLGVLPVLVIIRPVLSAIPDYAHWLFFLTGLLSLVSLALVWLGIRGFRKRENAPAVPEPEEKPAWAPAPEEPEIPQPAGMDVPAAPEPAPQAPPAEPSEVE